MRRSARHRRTALRSYGPGARPLATLVRVRVGVGVRARVRARVRVRVRVGVS